MSGPQTVPAQFVLPDKTTAVLVDDPQNFLANPSLARQIGTTAVHHMQLNEALIEAALIEPREVARLERQMGRVWATTPIDQIGRELEADQIIYAKIVNATGQFEGTVYRPKATLEVKVINAPDGKRLWPSSAALADPQATPTPGYRFTVEMNYDSRTGPAGRQGIPSDVKRRLADELGLKLGQIFYEWTLPEPGEAL